MSTVYITQMPFPRRDVRQTIYNPRGVRVPNPRYGEISGLDLSPAKEFGDLLELVPPTTGLSDVNAVMEELHTKLATFTDDDYLLCIGDPAVIAAAAMVASMVNDGVVSVLVWDRFDRKYYPVVIDIFNRMEIEP